MFARAQVLAHPGWTRSNFAAEPWYQRAVFYQVPDAAPNFKVLADRLDAMQSTGIDAVIVTPPTLPSLSGANAEQAIAAQAALDDFDNFTRQATARGIRVLVVLAATHVDADLSGRIRFWLTRGVAGLRIEVGPDANPEDRAAIAASARSLAANAGGQRVVLMDAPREQVSQAGDPVRSARSKQPARVSQNAASRSTASVQVVMLNGQLTAAALRPQLAAAFSAKDSLLDTRSGNSGAAQLAPVLATLALAGNSAALLDPAQPLILPATQPPLEPADDSAKPAPPPTPPQPPPGVYLPYMPYVPPPRAVKRTAPPPAAADPFTEWIAKLAALHHSNAALRTGTKTLLDFDTQNVLAWVAKPTALTPQNPAVVVLCNLSAQPVELSLEDAMKKLNLHGFFLRKLLRSDDAMGAEDLAAVKLAPYSVFIGEVRR